VGYVLSPFGLGLDRVIRPLISIEIIRLCRFQRQAAGEAAADQEAPRSIQVFGKVKTKGIAHSASRVPRSGDAWFAAGKRVRTSADTERWERAPRRERERQRYR
jgi:hypothetical protein